MHLFHELKRVPPHRVQIRESDGIRLDGPLALGRVDARPELRTGSDSPSGVKRQWDNL
jgi:hypothetical protein